MASQFIRIETYSRKADAKGRSVSFVLDEVERRPEASQHVVHPGEPRIVFGATVGELRALHSELVDGARNVDATGKARKVRVDQHTILTAVASHPATSASVRDDPVQAAAVDDWERRAVAWMRERWGDRLVSVVRHDDESHPHLHAYVLPDAPAMKARGMHPGLVAKEAEKAVAAAEGVTGKEANARGDRAYKAAMREFQDAYWQGVGLPSGMTRIGPGRRRLTRDAWHAERAAAVQAGEMVRVAEVARADAASVTSAAVEIREAAEARAAALAARGREFVAAARAAAAKATQDADAADARRREVERHAARVVLEAHAQVTRAQTWGAKIGGMVAGVVLGLVGMSPSRVAARAEASTADRVRAEMLPQLEKALDDREWANDRLTKVERANVALRASVAGLAAQRDRLAGQMPMGSLQARKPFPDPSP